MHLLHSRMLCLHQASTSTAMADRKRPQSRRQKGYRSDNVLRYPCLLWPRYTRQFSRSPRSRRSYGWSDDLLLCWYSLFLSSGIPWCESLRFTANVSMSEAMLIYWWYCIILWHRADWTFELKAMSEWLSFRSINIRH